MRRILGLAFLLILAAACGGDEESVPESLRLIAHDSFAGSVNEETFAGFTERTGIEVEVIAAGDAGSMVNQAALSKDNPLADVLFGVDDTFLSRALEEEIFVEHMSPILDKVDPGLVPDSDLVTPIDYGDVCLNYDKAWFGSSSLEVPSDLDQLRHPELAGKLTVEHPATSSPGLAFLLSTVEEYGEERFIAAVRSNMSLTPYKMCTALFASLRAFTGNTPQHDDTTYLAVKRMEKSQAA